MAKMTTDEWQERANRIDEALDALAPDHAQRKKGLTGLLWRWTTPARTWKLARGNGLGAGLDINLRCDDESFHVRLPFDLRSVEIIRAVLEMSAEENSR